ncbi:MAG: four helix bundle protein [Candidatus Omnitrophota bacterium]
MSKRFEDLQVWQLAVDLAVKIYKSSKVFPAEEIYGLTSQLRRAVVSVSTNIAEGSGRSSKKEYRHFVEIAIGSINEVENLWIIAQKIGYLKEIDFKLIKNNIEEVHGLLNGFRRYLSK